MPETANVEVSELLITRLVDRIGSKKGAEVFLSEYIQKHEDGILKAAGAKPKKRFAYSMCLNRECKWGGAFVRVRFNKEGEDPRCPHCKQSIHVDERW